jgi:two-component system sensor histidine kinase BaeS
VRLELRGTQVPLLAPADRERLKQVFYNLVHNAVKFSPPGGTIELSLEHVDAQSRPAAADAQLPPPDVPLVEVRVADQGVGIAPGDLERIFERFHQAEPTLRREHGGLGLGLPISRGIVRSHGGEIIAERRDGGGSVFRVLLPRRRLPPDGGPTVAAGGRPEA